jgi:hypothetical protein
MGEEQVRSSEVTPGSCLVRSGLVWSGQVRSGGKNLFFFFLREWN